MTIVNGPAESVKSTLEDKVVGGFRPTYCDVSVFFHLNLYPSYCRYKKYLNPGVFIIREFCNKMIKAYTIEKLFYRFP